MLIQKLVKTKTIQITEIYQILIIHDFLNQTMAQNRAFFHIELLSMSKTNIR